MRILLNPTPVEGGGTVTPPAPATPPPAPAAPVAQTPPATPEPPTIPMPVEQYTRLIELERQHVAARDEAERKSRDNEAKAAAALVAEGEARKQLEQFTAASQQREATADQKLRTQAAKVAIAEAMAGIPFADDFAREDARTLLAGMVTVEKDAAGEYVVLDRENRQEAAKSLRERLQGPRFARYRAAPHQGGGGGGGGPAPTPPSGQPPAEGDWVKELTAIALKGRPKGGNSFAYPLAGFPGN
jgi:hypothetical protein